MEWFISAIKLLLLLTSYFDLSRGDFSTGAIQAVRCLLFHTRAPSCSDIPEVDVPSYLIKAFNDSPSSIQEALRHCQLSGLTPTQVASLPVSLLYLIPRRRLCELNEDQLAAIMQQYADDTSLAHQLMTVAKQENRLMQFLLKIKLAGLSQGVQQVIGAALTLEVLNHTLEALPLNQPLLAYLHPNVTLHLNSDTGFGLLFHLQNLKGSEQPEKEAVYTLAQMALNIQFPLENINWLVLGLSPNEIKDKAHQTWPKYEYFKLDLSISQVRAVFDQLYENVKLNKFQAIDCLHAVAKLTPSQLQKLPLLEFSFDSVLQDQIHSLPAACQLREYIKTDCQLTGKIPKLEGEKWRYRIRYLQNWVYTLPLAALQEYIEDPLKTAYLSEIDSPYLSPIQAFYLTGKGRGMDVQVASSVMVSERLLSALPTSKLLRQPLGNVSSSVVEYLAANLPADNFPRTLAWVLRITPIIGEGFLLDDLLNNKDVNSILGLISPKDFKAAAKKMLKWFTDNQSKYASVIKNFPQEILATLLHQAQLSEDWSWQLLLDESHVTHLLVGGLTCQLLEHMEPGLFIPIMAKYNRHRGHAFPKNLQICSLRKLIDYLNFKMSITQADSSLGLISVLEPIEIESVGGYVLAGLPVDAVRVSLYREHILASIGKLSNAALILAADIGHLNALAKLAMDKENSADVYHIGNLAWFLPVNVTMPLLKTMVQSGRLDHTLCLPEASRRSLALKLLDIFGHPEQWNAGVLSSLNDLLVVFNEEELLSVTRSAWTDVGDILHSHYGDHIEWISPTPFYQMCTRVLGGTEGDKYKLSVRRFVRWQLQAAQWLLDTIKSLHPSEGSSPIGDIIPIDFHNLDEPTMTPPSVFTPFQPKGSITTYRQFSPSSTEREITEAMPVYTNKTSESIPETGSETSKTIYVTESGQSEPTSVTGSETVRPLHLTEGTSPFEDIIPIHILNIDEPTMTPPSVFTPLLPKYIINTYETFSPSSTEREITKATNVNNTPESASVTETATSEPSSLTSNGKPPHPTYYTSPIGGIIPIDFQNVDEPAMTPPSVFISMLHKDVKNTPESTSVTGIETSNTTFVTESETLEFFSVSKIKISNTTSVTESETSEPTSETSNTTSVTEGETRESTSVTGIEISKTSSVTLSETSEPTSITGSEIIKPLHLTEGTSAIGGIIPFGIHNIDEPAMTLPSVFTTKDVINTYGKLSPSSTESEITHFTHVNKTPELTSLSESKMSQPTSVTKIKASEFISVIERGTPESISKTGNKTSKFTSVIEGETSNYTSFTNKETTMIISERVTEKLLPISIKENKTSTHSKEKTFSTSAFPKELPDLSNHIINANATEKNRKVILTIVETGKANQELSVQKTSKTQIVTGLEYVDQGEHSSTVGLSQHKSNYFNTELLEIANKYKPSEATNDNENKINSKMLLSTTGVLPKENSFNFSLMTTTESILNIATKIDVISDSDTNKTITESSFIKNTHNDNHFDSIQHITDEHSHYYTTNNKSEPHLPVDFLNKSGPILNKFRNHSYLPNLIREIYEEKYEEEFDSDEISLDNENSILSKNAHGRSRRRAANSEPAIHVSCNAIKIVGHLSEIALKEQDFRMMSSSEIEECRVEFGSMDLSFSIRNYLWIRISQQKKKEATHLLGKLLHAMNVGDVWDLGPWTITEPWVLETIHALAVHLNNTALLNRILEKVEQDNPEFPQELSGSLGGSICLLNWELVNHVSVPMAGLDPSPSHQCTKCLPLLARKAIHQLGPVTNWTPQHVHSLGTIVAGLELNDWQLLTKSPMKPISALKPSAIVCLNTSHLEILSSDNIEEIPTLTLLALLPQQLDSLNKTQLDAVRKATQVPVDQLKLTTTVAGVPSSASHCTLSTLFIFTSLMYIFSFSQGVIYNL